MFSGPSGRPTWFLRTHSVWVFTILFIVTEKEEQKDIVWVYIDTIIVNYLNVYFLIGKVRLFAGSISACPGPGIVTVPGYPAPPTVLIGLTGPRISSALQCTVVKVCLKTGRFRFYFKH